MIIDDIIYLNSPSHIALIATVSVVIEILVRKYP